METNKRGEALSLVKLFYIIITIATIIAVSAAVVYVMKQGLG